MNPALVAEYIWLDVNKNIRSKTKVMTNLNPIWTDMDQRNQLTPQELATCLPNWNFDGSSTGQAEGLNSELILKPVAVYNDPFRQGQILVLCGTYDKDDKPLESNYRDKANEFFEYDKSQEPWFGIEQEYFVFSENSISVMTKRTTKQGKFYCSVGMDRALHRNVAEEHLLSCLRAGLHISGINAEVAPGQWEYQIGPCEGINAGDELWISRYILERVAENLEVEVSFNPKPFEHLNGSGCHTNYSTKEMREEGGLAKIYTAINKLSQTHAFHMKLYGKGNEKRMTGLYETSKFDEFTFNPERPVDRSASIRVGYETIKNGCGYFEDRRPASTMDPYMVTSGLFYTTVLVSDSSFERVSKNDN